MPSSNSTCWTLLRDAAAGSHPSRAEFAVRYVPVVRAYLAARWRDSFMLHELDDTVQDVFIECLRGGGVLDRARADHPGGFRAFLYGAVRHVAQRAEKRRSHQRERQPNESIDLDRIPSRDEALACAFDRAWAKAVVSEAAARQVTTAGQTGEAAKRRVELLRMRFHEGLPIREIAQRWGIDAAALHHEYARARKEFHVALREVIAFHHPGGAGEIDQECAQLLSMLE